MKGHALYGAARAGTVMGMIASGLNGSHGSSTPPGGFSAHGCNFCPFAHVVFGNEASTCKGVRALTSHIMEACTGDSMVVMRSSVNASGGCSKSSEGQESALRAQFSVDSASLFQAEGVSPIGSPCVAGSACWGVLWRGWACM